MLIPAPVQIIARSRGSLEMKTTSNWLKSPFIIPDKSITPMNIEITDNKISNITRMKLNFFVLMRHLQFNGNEYMLALVNT